MSEPTSILTFSDLIIKVAEKLGIAYYGASGTEAAQVPSDAHDLALTKRIVNDGIRMFINDAPHPNGWRWLRPVASLILWPSVAVDTVNPILTAIHSAGLTTITVTSAAFYPSMALKDIVIPTVGTFNIASYTSSTVIVVTGNASAAHAASKTFSVTADGNYTMPDTFGGQVLGHPTFAAGTNRGSSLEWVDESLIRELRANEDISTSTPLQLAFRIKDSGVPRRQWELMTWPIPGEVFTIQFPFMLHFQSLINLTDTSPAPFGHDESVRAACLAVAEKDVEDAMGNEWKYYREISLPNSYRIDALSAPHKLGYFGNGPRGPMRLDAWRDYVYQRPNVTFNP